MVWVGSVRTLSEAFSLSQEVLSHTTFSLTLAAVCLLKRDTSIDWATEEALLDGIENDF